MNENFEVEAGSCYRNPDHLEKDRLVLKQNGKVVEPTKIKQTSKQIKAGTFVNQITAEFGLTGIDPQAMSTFVLIPAVGEEFEFAVNLASMP